MVQCEYDNHKHNIHTSTQRHGININNSDIGWAIHKVQYTQNVQEPHI